MARLLAMNASASQAGKECTAALIAFSKDFLVGKVFDRTPEMFILRFMGKEYTAMLGVNTGQGCVAAVLPQVFLDLLRLQEKIEDRWPTFAETDHFAVHVLDAGGLEACQRFAWGDPMLKAGEFEEGLGGAPLIGGWVSRFECRTERRIAAEDHLLIIGRVERFESREGEALVFYRGAYGPVGGG